MIEVFWIVTLPLLVVVLRTSNKITSARLVNTLPVSLSKILTRMAGCDTLKEVLIGELDIFITGLTDEGMYPCLAKDTLYVPNSSVPDFIYEKLIPPVVLVRKLSVAEEGYVTTTEPLKIPEPVEASKNVMWFVLFVVKFMT